MAFETLEKADPYKELFAHPERLELEGGTVEVVDVRPSPEKLKTDIPLVIQGGWMHNVETWETTATLLAKEGRRVIVIGAPHGVEPGNESVDLPPTEVRKAVAFKRILDAKHIERTFVMTHSEGNVFTSAAILEEPARVPALICDSPFGLIGKDTFWSLAWRYGQDIMEEEREARAGKGGVERKAQKEAGLTGFKRSALSWPEKLPAGLRHLRAAFHSLQEARDMATVQAEQNLRELRRRGVKVYIMHPVGDRVSPIERQVGTPTYDIEGKPATYAGRILMEKEGVVKADMVDGYMAVGDPSGTGEIADTHNAPFLSPRQYAVAIDSLLDTVERNIAREKLYDKTE